ncbi:hypothetical protein [Paenibacillus vortex]|uniref:hypothetical protein n=1 Tax=Paenibacillus vortex TaxID=71995 RepID=UPI003AF2F2D7
MEGQERLYRQTAFQLCRMCSKAMFKRRKARQPEGMAGGGTRRTPPASESTAQEQEVRASEPEFEPSPSDILLPERSKPPADVLADKTAGLLQQLSDQSIRWVVSMFGSITD